VHFWSHATARSRKPEEEQRKEIEVEQKARDRLFDEWEHIKVNVRQLRKILKKTDEDDIQFDIDALTIRKKLLANI